MRHDSSHFWHWYRKDFQTDNAIKPKAAKKLQSKQVNVTLHQMRGQHHRSQTNHNSQFVPNINSSPSSNKKGPSNEVMREIPRLVLVLFSSHKHSGTCYTFFYTFYTSALEQNNCQA